MRKAAKKGETVFEKILCSFLYISKRWWAGGKEKAYIVKEKTKLRKKKRIGGQRTAKNWERRQQSRLKIV